MLTDKVLRDIFDDDRAPDPPCSEGATVEFEEQAESTTSAQCADSGAADAQNDPADVAGTAVEVDEFAEPVTATNGTRDTGDEDVKNLPGPVESSVSARVRKTARRPRTPLPDFRL